MVSSRSRRWPGGASLHRASPWLIALLLVGGLLFDAWVADHHYPIERWIFFSYVRAWLFATLCGLASLACGWRLLRFVSPTSGRLGERLVLAFALGVLAFYTLMFVGGVAKLYGRPFFFALPLALFAFAGRETWTTLVRTHRHLRRFGARLWTPRNAVEWLAAPLLLLLILAAYLQEMLPANIAFDARWYHLPIAEHYVAAGGIVRFEEGWYLGAYPQLASILYTWAFLAPGTLFDHVLLCAHLEFCIFLATLLGMTVLTERLVGRTRLPFAAAGVALFPGLFLYDSNLNVSADHVLAFWGPPILLSLLRLDRDFSTRKAVCSGLVTAGALCTKYQACYFFVPATLYLAAMSAAKRKLAPGAAWVAAVALATATHWVKNLVYYHDPLYPLLHVHLPSWPFHRGAAELLDDVYWPKGYEARGDTWWEKIRNALQTSVTFAFTHDGQSVFPGPVRPGFGALFTLSTPLLLLLRPRRRLWIVVGAMYLGLVTWYLTSHQQRFLQTLMPCMAAATVALLCVVRRHGWPAHAATALLVGSQLVHSADLYFTPYHAMIGDSPLRSLTDYLGSPYKREYEHRYEIANREQAVAAKLPPGAKVLLHHHMLKLGLGAQTVVDSPGWQGAVEYLHLSSPSAVNALWSQLGVTNFVWPPERDDQSPAQVARELVFLRALEQYADDPADMGGWRTASRQPTPKNAPLAHAPTHLAWFGCGEDPPAGAYSPEGLKEGRAERPLDPSSVASMPLAQLAEVNAIALRRDCAGLSSVAAALPREFVRRGRLDAVELWIRAREHAHESAECCRDEAARRRL